MQNYSSLLRKSYERQAKFKIYVFGNPLIKEDSLPLRLLPELKKKFPKIDFVITDPNENFPPEGENNLIILDTVLGIKEPMILDLNDFKKLRKTPVSPHDYDLVFHLLLLKKRKKIEKVIIIGIPQNTSLNTPARRLVPRSPKDEVGKLVRLVKRVIATLP